MPTKRKTEARKPQPARPLTVRHLLPAGGRLLTGGLLTRFAGNPERVERRPDDRRNPNFGRDGKRHPEDERKPRYKTELLIRTVFGDVGARPLTDPNLVFWESPDIWIDGPSGDPDQATPGVLNTVNVHLWNVGLADCWAAHVDLYWCDPSVGITPALANPIGSTVITLMGGAHTVVQFPWLPSSANGGHECLVAQAYDPVSDPLVAPFSPTLDRHVAQRNISVVEAVPSKPFQLGFDVSNLTMATAHSTLSVELLTGAARGRFLQTIGAPKWSSLGQTSVPTLAAMSRREVPIEGALLQRATGALRERLDPEPGPVTLRRVTGALSALAGSRGKPSRAALRDAKASWKLETEPGPGRGRGAFEAPPHTIIHCVMQGKAPPGRARADARDIVRVVERMNGRVTGGLTIIVKPARSRAMR
jgi:hypothetical protein